MRHRRGGRKDVSRQRSGVRPTIYEVLGAVSPHEGTHTRLLSHEGCISCEQKQIRRNEAARAQYSAESAGTLYSYQCMTGCWPRCGTRNSPATRYRFLRGGWEDAFFPRWPHFSWPETLGRKDISPWDRVDRAVSGTLHAMGQQQADSGRGSTMDRGLARLGTRYQFHTRAMEDDLH